MTWFAAIPVGALIAVFVGAPIIAIFHKPGRRQWLRLGGYAGLLLVIIYIAVIVLAYTYWPEMLVPRIAK